MISIFESIFLLLHPITFYCTELLKKMIDKNRLFFDTKRTYKKQFDIYQFIFILFLLTKTFAKGYDFKCFQIKNKKGV
ncbi:hypothetical protein DSH71_06360 [Enterococcus faecium]|nr:hypothetical protein [Enterococcus faecium]